MRPRRRLRFLDENKALGHVEDACLIKTSKWGSCVVIGHARNYDELSLLRVEETEVRKMHFQTGLSHSADCNSSQLHKAGGSRQASWNKRCVCHDTKLYVRYRRLRSSRPFVDDLGRLHLGLLSTIRP